MFEKINKTHYSRTRLGVLVPSKTVVTEPEFNRMTPEGVTCHFHRFIYLGTRTGLAPEEEAAEKSRVTEELMGLGDLAVEASEVIAHIKPSAVAMA